MLLGSCEQALNDLESHSYQTEQKQKFDCCRDLHSYLLGDQEENENNANQQPNNHHARNNNAIPVVGEGLHAAHQAILQQGGPVGFQPYRRPLKFPLRVSYI